uniref:Reverse transcriptase Ty1/copia-type domain-containing protein n=1 Tax=Tanacetum cinerariifolium TaxID=118510 RepID=A0A699J0S2_TANCI|nr:hypothetical protein [Tanacetum cinerariifolium]
MNTLTQIVVERILVTDELQVTHQRKYPQWVSSSEVVSVLNYQRFAKLEKFEGVDFRRWQKNMHFMLSSMSVVYVLTTSMPEDEELWDTLEAKYMAEDASIKKFLVCYFTNYKMIDSRRVLEQYNELLEYLEDFKHTLKHLKEKLTLIELGSHLRIEKSLRVHDSDKPKRKNIVGPSIVNMVEHNNSSRYNDNKGKRTHHDTIANLNKKPKVTCWKYGKPGHLKEMVNSMLSYSGLSQWFYVIEPNDSVAINSIIKSRDIIFDEHMFSSVPKPSQRSLVKGTEDPSGSVVSKRVTDEIVQQFEPDLRKSKRHRTPKDFRPEFQLYFIKGTRDEVSDKEAINDEMNSIMRNNTWVLTDLPPGCRPLGCKWIFKKNLKVDEIVEKFKARMVIQGFKQKSMIDYFDTYAHSKNKYHQTADCYGIYSIHQIDVKTAFLNGELEKTLGLLLNSYMVNILPMVDESRLTGKDAHPEGNSNEV